jgi:hypothetical protein
MKAKASFSVSCKCECGSYVWARLFAAKFKTDGLRSDLEELNIIKEWEEIPLEITNMIVYTHEKTATCQKCGQEYTFENRIIAQNFPIDKDDSEWEEFSS